MSRFWDPLMKRPIMDGFQSLRYLWKRLDKTFQSIMLKFLKSKNLTNKRACIFFMYKAEKDSTKLSFLQDFFYVLKHFIETLP